MTPLRNQSPACADSAPWYRGKPVLFLSLAAALSVSALMLLRSPTLPTFE